MLTLFQIIYKTAIKAKNMYKVFFCMHSLILQEFNHVFVPDSDQIYTAVYPDGASIHF